MELCSPQRQAGYHFCPNLGYEEVADLKGGGGKAHSHDQCLDMLKTDRVNITSCPHNDADVSKEYVATLHFLKPLQNLRAVKLTREGC